MRAGPGWTLGRGLQIMIAAAAATALIVDAWLYTRLRTGTFILHMPPPQGRYEPAYFTGTNVSGWAQLPVGISLAAGVVWLVWQHRATSKLWARRYADLSISPGWAVGWWFIPVAWWFMPCLAMLELDRRSTPDGVPRRASPIIGVWWAAWLAAWIVPVVGVAVAVLPRFADLAERVDETTTTIDFSTVVHAAAPWPLVWAVLQAVAGLLAVAVVRRIDDAQEAMVAAPSGWLIPVPLRPDATG